MKKIYCVICSTCRKVRSPNISYILEKTFFSIICTKCKNENEEVFKTEESTEMLKFLGLIENI